MPVTEIEGVNFATGSSWDADGPFMWTRFDTEPNLISGFTIRRGRQDALGRIPTGTATITANDRDGVFTPTVSIQPRMPVALALYNPVLETWHTVFRGLTESYGADVDKTQQVDWVTIECVDLLEVLSSVEVAPGGAFGQAPPDESQGDVFYEDASPNGPQVRIEGALDEAGVPASLFQINTGNVGIQETVYAPGTSILTICQEAADAEFPGIGLFYVNREGVIRFTGRQVRFRPEVVDYDVDIWKAGDGAAVNASPSDTAHVRGMTFSEGRDRVINVALAMPQIYDADETEYQAHIASQIVSDPTSIASFGTCPWSAENLLTDGGVATGNDKWEETLLFAQYYVENYATSVPRVDRIVFRSIRPDAPGAEWTWRVICEVDINDIIRLTVATPGGASSFFTETDYYVEGITYEVSPLGSQPYANVTLTLDVSPRANYTTNPFDEDPDPS